jgi:hypothetical protein
MTSEHAGLIQHGHTLRLLRAFGTTFVAFGLLGVVGGIAILTTGTAVRIGLTMSALWLCIGALGVVMLLRYQQQSFEVESKRGPVSPTRSGRAPQAFALLRLLSLGNSVASRSTAFSGGMNVERRR